MSKEYDNTNRGVLFKNESKESDKHPDYSGNINVGGQEFFLDAWIKEGKASKKKFMSLSCKPKTRRASPPTGGKNDPRPATVDNDFNDDIGF